ncbi:hypothetical protein [Bifidobacterium indicum]|uniref:hypothetical protein n=1 Tax=Bifidobacterium indicum TaxID=1691 RepID=UPI0030D85593
MDDFYAEIGGLALIVASILILILGTRMRRGSVHRSAMLSGPSRYYRTDSLWRHVQKAESTGMLIMGTIWFNFGIAILILPNMDSLSFMIGLGAFSIETVLAICDMNFAARRTYRASTAAGHDPA